MIRRGGSCKRALLLIDLVNPAILSLFLVFEIGPARTTQRRRSTKQRLVPYSSANAPSVFHEGTLLADSESRALAESQSLAQSI